MEFLTYRHVVNLGDLISALPGIKHLYEVTGKKAIIYQQLNRAGEYFEGATHPTKDENSQMVCFNDQMFEMLRPLLLAQEYIEDFRIYKGERIDYDLDIIRLQVYCGAPNYSLHKWTWMAYPEMSCDLSIPWIQLPFVRVGFDDLTISPEKIMDIYKQTGKLSWKYEDKSIVINFTERYRNNNINYFFLKEYEKHIQFVGTKAEYELFKKKWNLDISYYEVSDFVNLASVISQAVLFLGNQSFCWHLAEAQKVPRVLELDLCFQNCTSFGANGYEAYHQPQMEYLVYKLYNS